LKLSDLKLPLSTVNALKDSSLAYHLLHDDQVHGVVNLWKEAKAMKIAFPVYNRAAEFARNYPADMVFPYMVDQIVRELSR
jgi:hypothetical protein